MIAATSDGIDVLIVVAVLALMFAVGMLIDWHQRDQERRWERLKSRGLA